MNYSRDELIQISIDCKAEINQAMTKERLMDALALRYHELENSNKPLLQQVAIMKPKNFNDLEESARQVIFNSAEWLVCEKINGRRIKLHITADGNRLDGRDRSVKTFEYTERTDNFPHLRDMENLSDIADSIGTVLDGELQMPVDCIYTSTGTHTVNKLQATIAVSNCSPEKAIVLQEKYGWCRFHAFDILFYAGRDVRNETHAQRQKLLYRIVSNFVCDEISIVLEKACDTIDVKTFLHQILTNGGEGVIFKQAFAKYESGKRCKCWYKWKPFYEEDCFITGYEPGTRLFDGLVGSLLVSVHTVDSQLKEVAAIPCGSMTNRLNLSMSVSGELIDKIYGKVVRVKYQYWSKNHRLMHATVNEESGSFFHEDKEAHECVTEHVFNKTY